MSLILYATPTHISYGIHNSLQLINKFCTNYMKICITITVKMAKNNKIVSVQQKQTQSQRGSTNFCHNKTKKAPE